jgi:ADP-heptose:LPS heptosyltransferase
LGDVAMTVPVLKCLLQQHEQLRITVVSSPFFQPLFDDIERLDFYGVDIKKEYKGLLGIKKLSNRIQNEIPFDAIADLHNVIRTKLLRYLLNNKKVAVIDKGRKEKAELTRLRNKQLRRLKSTFQRYADVFASLGYPVQLNEQEGIKKLNADTALIPFEKIHNDRLIGIAPFAKHPAKVYPLEKMLQVIKMLAENGYKILLFGSKREAAELEMWAKENKNIYSVAGKLSFENELQLVAQLDIMVSMDSANMHLASLYGVPVVSIWGGTHPFLGFYGWAQQYGNAVQEDLPCRPSSVYGNKICPVHGTQGCMQGITPEIIVKKIKEVSQSK